MDVQYLKDNVGPVLTEALVQLAIDQPEDAVDFVGTFLLRYVENQKKDQKVSHSSESTAEKSLRERDITSLV